MRRLLWMIACLLCLTGSAWAAGTCNSGGKTGTSPYTAASLSNADIQGCINAVESGATITLPSGSATWSGSVTVSKAVTLSGQTVGCPTSCIDNTVITPATNQLLIAANNVRVTGITFSGPAASFGHIWVNKTGAATSNSRIDHNHFLNFSSGRAITHGGYASAPGYYRDYPALIDNNRFATASRNKAIECYGHSETTMGSYDEPIGLGGGDFLFIEDNIFQFSTMPDGVSGIDCDSNAKVVVRFNTFNNADFYTHGEETCTYITGVCVYRATHAIELYKNNFNFTVSPGYSVYIRGGTGYVWGNTFTGSETAYANRFRYMYERGDLTRTCLNAGACQGLNPSDGNEPGKYGYPCYLQIGMTGSNGITPLPLRHWMNTDNGATVESAMVTVTYDAGCNYQHVQVGRDILLHERSFVGTTLPATCTVNQAYWKTNEGYWNNKTPGTAAGVLYKCTATNTWSLYYTPYQYPHPLTTSTGCSGASPSWTCTSWGDLKTLVEGASILSGDTVTLAAGTHSATATITVPSTKKITIQGTGTGCPDSCSTTVNASVGNVINIQNSGSRVAYLRIINSVCCENECGVVQAKHRDWQVDHNYFQCTVPGTKQTVLSYTHRASYYPAYHFGGVFHSNRAIQGTVDVYGSGFGLNASALASAAVPTRLGSDEAVYFEDNVFENTDAGNFVDSNYIGAYVFRFNTLTRTGTTGSSIEAHGLQTATGFRGTRKWEIYHNTINCNEGDAGLLRAGTGVLFNNVVNATAGCLNTIRFDNRRSPGGDGSPTCDGTQSDYDSNEGTGDGAGWLCRDQIGSGYDLTAYDGSLPEPPQAKEPVYTWGNTNASLYVVSFSAVHIVENRDIYWASSATGSPQTVGVRTGTKSQMPVSCTTGVAFWVTDEGYWNTKNDTPTVTADGVLYKCTATNTWTPFYTPLSYPHPLRSGLSAPTGVK